MCLIHPCPFLACMHAGKNIHDHARCKFLVKTHCIAEFGPDVDVEIVCGYGGSVVVMWGTADQDNVDYLQVEYSCGDNSGHSQVRMFGIYIYMFTF